MKKYLTEFDELQAALKQVKINETVMPYHNGHLVYENADSYAKIQKLLDCPEMASSHRYLYDLDVDDLQENEVQKVDALFDLGVKKGYIDNSFEDEFEKEQAEEAGENDETVQAVCQPCQQKAPVACWTVLYSATKNGEIKTGECYSNAINVQSAKADCLAKLARFGYENVSVLAIEAGDPDLCGCSCDENVMLRNRHHNAHADQPLSEGDKDDLAAADADQLEETGKNPYAAGLKVVTGNAKPKTLAKSKKLSEDDESSDAASGSDDTSDDSNGNSDSSSSGGSNSNSPDDSDGSADDSADDSNDGSGNNSASDSEDDDSSDEDSSDDDSSDSSNDKGSSDDSDSESSDGEESDDSDDSDDSEDDSNSEDNSGSDGDSDSDESSDDEDSDDEDSDDEGSDDDADSDGTEYEKELSDDERSQFKDEYKRVFKETMLKCKFEGKCFNDLTLDQKVDFFTKLSEKWTKADPKKFMTDKEQDQLEAVVMSK